MRTSRLLRGFSLLCVLLCAASSFSQTQPPNAVPLISQITPASIPPSTDPNLIVQFSLTILGANFPANAVVKLTIPGGPSFTAASVSVNSTGTQIKAFFNTTLPRPAVYSVTVANPSNNPAEVSNVFYLPITPAATTVGMSGSQSPLLSGTPVAMVSGDFNGDGNPDVAVVWRNPNTVSIRLGNFGGFLSAGASYSVGNYPTGIVAADFNGDGILDLAVSNSADNTISIFLGSAYGNFQPPITIADTGSYPTQMVAADFNGDGHMDLAVVNACGATAGPCYPTAPPLGPPSLLVLLGNGDGTFSALPSTVTTGNGPSAIAAADFNSDGFIDLVVANSQDNTLTLFMGNGDGTFTPAQSTMATGHGPSAIAIADFNRDGKLDIAVTNSADGNVAILLNQNCGLPAASCTFSPVPPIQVGSYPSAIAAGDMNADGLVDLVVANQGSNSIGVLLGDGTGNFTPVSTPPGGSFSAGSPIALALADFSGDGRLDVETVGAYTVGGGYTLLTQTAVPQVILTLSNSSPVYGQPMTYTAQVNPSIGTQPTGSVTFFDGGVSIGGAPLNGYQANFFSSTPNVGAHQITATYNGDGNFLPNTSAAVTETVSQAQTSLTLSSNVNTVAYGQPFTLSATVVISNLGTPTGTVSFFDKSTSTSLGTASVTNSVAQLTLSNLLPGAHVITSIYTGDANFLGSSSPTYTENITQASTTTTISTSSSSIALGQTVTFTATVQPSVSAPATGFVAFFADGSTSLGAAPIVNNMASLQVSNLTLGTRAITAQYTGDSNYLGSTSQFIAETVNRAFDTVSLVMNPNPTVYGQAMTFTATVQPIYYSGTPTGTVLFADGSTNLGAATLTNGSAQFTIATLAAGSHAITATYSGDTNFQTTMSLQIMQSVGQATSTTALGSSQNPSSFSQPITLSATVQPQFGGAATGLVSFFDGSVLLGSSNLSANVATLSVSNLSVGAHSITARYAGDNNVALSNSSAVSQTVNPSPTTTMVTSNANPSAFGQGVTFTANVTAAYGILPSSTVSFYDGTTLLGTINMATAPPQITTAYLPAGAHSITAQYAGNSNYASSTSAAVTQTVNQASTTTTVSSNLNPSAFDQPITLTAVVDSTYHMNSNGGTVTFYNSGTPIGSAIISGNAVNLTISSLPTGTNSITASYGGDGNLLASTSGVFAQTINPAPVSPTIGLSSYSTTYGQAITMTSNVKPVYGGTPTGTVTFWLNWPTTALGTGTLVNGTAQATTTAVPVGSRSIYATYNGDANFASGSSLPTQLTVSQATTTTVTSVDVNPENYGQTVTVSATVQSSGGTPTGSVTFLDGSATLGTTSLTNGAAQLAVSSFAAGAHAITAKFSGDTNFAGSTSAGVTETVNQATSATTVSASAYPTTFGQTVTLTATVQPSVGSSVSGTVTFLDGSTTLGTATLSSNAAQLTVSSLALGSHAITAVYGGNANFAGSTSAALTETVNQAPTAVTINSSLNPATFGQGVPFVATVQPASGGAVTGSVTFYDGTNALVKASVVNNNTQHNVAQLIAAGLLGGTHSITAVYSGDANYTGSTSTALTETVNPASSTVSIAASLNPATFGQAITLTASVTPSISGDQASGAVTFFDGTTSLGAANLSNNSAQLSVSNLAAGSHSITAKYAGDANFAGSTSSVLSETVNQSSTTITLVSNLNPATFGQGIPFVATVQPSLGGAATGTVTFYDGTNVLGTSSVVNNGSQQNVAQLTAAGLLGGTHSIGAVYSGDTNYTGSTSSALTETVSPASSTVSVAASLNPATFGQAITLTASVTPSISGDQASGAVMFFDGTTSLGAANLSNNSAQFSISNLAPGSHSITAKYAGDANFAGNTSAALSETINQVTTTTTLVSSLNPATAGQSVTFTATVQAGAGNSATGNVTFLDGSTTLGTTSLSGGSAPFTTSSLAPGSHSLTAVYSGSTDFAGSTSAVLSETIGQVTTTNTLASSLDPATAGQSVTFTATIQAGAGNSATGTVTFLDGSTTLGTAAVNSNSAQFATSSLAPGSHSIIAVYSGSTNFAASTSSALTETVNLISTTTTLASSANPALAGQTATFTATIQAGAGNSAAGTVTFYDGSSTLGTVTVASNSAQLTLSTLAVGAHSITAVYSGGGDFGGSTSSALSETVNQSGTSTTVVSNLNPATFGQAVPFVATVQTASGGAATGTVTFYDGSSTLGTAMVANNGGHNTATLTYAGFQGGTHSVTAAYGGDANYSASSSSALTETVNPASSTVSAAASANPATYGQAVTLTATVVPSVSAAPVTGTVTFFDGSTSLGTANLSSSAAQISVASFSLGSHSITASYAGDRNFAGNTSNVLTETVNSAATSTVLGSNANPVLVGKSVTFSATVSSTVAGTQSGPVSFYFDGSNTAAASVNLSNGTANYSTSSLSAGSHSVVAVFASTNANFAGSTSSTFTQYVSDFTISVSPSSLTLARNSSGTYTLTIASVGEFSGTVSLTCGGAPGGTTCAISPTQVTLNGSGSAQATVTINAAANASKGSHTLMFTGTSGGLNRKVTASLTID